jgi:hypothetical protein
VATASVAAAVVAWAILPNHSPNAPVPPVNPAPVGAAGRPPDHEAAQYQELVDYSIAQSTHGSISDTN